MLKSRLCYQPSRTAFYPALVATTVTLISLFALNAAHLNAPVLVLSAMCVIVGASIFCSLRRQQKHLPQTISIDERGCLALNNNNTKFSILKTSRCTPWFVFLVLRSHTKSTYWRHVLWSKSMTSSDFRTLARLVHRTRASLLDNEGV